MGDQIKVDKIVEALECVRILMGSREGNIPARKDTGTDGKIILKRIYKTHFQETEWQVVTAGGQITKLGFHKRQGI